jgi:hypothetical protein
MISVGFKSGECEGQHIFLSVLTEFLACLNENNYFEDLIFAHLVEWS